MSEQRSAERRAPGLAGRRDGDTRNVTREEFEAVQAAVLQWTRRSIWLLRLIVVGIIVTALAGSLLVKANGDRVDDIERARRDAIIFTCQETNERHDKSLAALEILSQDAIDRDPERAAEIRQSTEAFKLFVNALVPKRDCQQRADELTGVVLPAA